MIGDVAGRAAGLVVTGLAGAVAYDGVKRLARAETVHRAAVTLTSWGMLGARVAETGAERARLAAADIAAEARERIGEQTRPPGAPAGHDHEH
jgi:hypothetical protein